MAQYTVKHSCGHEETHALFGPGKERTKKLDWLETTPCKECYKAVKRAEGPKVTVRAVTGHFAADGHNAIEIIVTNSFDVKDILKERGYKFGRFSLPTKTTDLYKMLMDEGAPGWARIITGDLIGNVEIDWVCAQGWPVDVLDGPNGVMSGYFMAVAEGRPDVALLPNREGNNV